MKNIIIQFFPSTQSSQNYSGDQPEYITLNYQAGHDQGYKNPMEYSHLYPHEPIKAYREWKNSYEKFLESFASKDKSSHEKPRGEVSASDFKTKENQVKLNFENAIEKFNEWFSNLRLEDNQLLNDKIRQDILESRAVRTPEKIKIVIQTENRDIQNLFWNHLTLVKNNDYKDYIGVIYAIPNMGSARVDENILTKNELKILVIYGDGAKELEADNELQVWQEWEQKANQVPNVCKVTTIHAPNTFGELRQTIKEDNWDIIYFTGHGSHYPIEFMTEREMIKVCNESQTIDKFCTFLNSNNTPPRLIILSCCEGLNIAKKLLTKGTPQVLFMREKITPQDSVTFLKQFLQEFEQESCLHIALNKTQCELYHGSSGIGSDAIMALLQLPNTQHLEWNRNHYVHSSQNIIQKFISNRSLESTISILIAGVVSSLLTGVLLTLLAWYFVLKPKRLNDALRYTFDIYVVNQEGNESQKANRGEHYTGYFIDKEQHLPNSHGLLKTYTYIIVVPQSLVEHLKRGKKIQIKTEKGEIISLDKTNSNNYSDIQNSDYATLSFQSNESYDFPELDLKPLVKMFLEKQEQIKLISEKNVMIYRKDAHENNEFNEPYIGTLIGKYKNKEAELNPNESKYIYYGYILDPSLISYIKNSGNLLEVRTLKEESFENIENSQKNIENSQQSDSTFNYDYIETKNIVFFSFSSNENYDVNNLFNNIEDLKDLKQQYDSSGQK